MKYIQYISVIIIAVLFSACQKDEIEGTIFIDPVVDSTAYTYEFDQWLNRHFTQTYNVDYQYKLDDSATDPNYNIVPVRLGMADTVAHLSLYLWYDAYKDVVGPDFLVEYGPKIIQLIGSSMINAAQGTEKLGYAEGGIKIVLMKINAMEVDNMDQLNEYIFKTMHHEFSHILHQRKTYPKEFEMITPANYDPSGWQYRADSTAWKLGYVSAYGSSEVHEDFVETIANYIVKSDEDWNHILTVAGPEGSGYILRKLDIIRTWLSEQYNYDIDLMRANVQYRQENLDWDVVMHMYE